MVIPDNYNLVPVPDNVVKAIFTTLSGTGFFISINDNYEIFWHLRGYMGIGFTIII